MSALRFFAQPPKLSAWRVRTIPCFAIVMACGLLTAVSRLPSTAAGLGPDVIAREQQSGGFQPVTAVLMNFRGYDTHLEMVVLLVAAIGVHSLKRERAASITEPSPLLPALVALIVPASIIVAGYLVWRGSHAPGGAFQAGAILAGAAVLLRLSHRLPPLGPDSPVIRLTLVFGPMLFLGLAIAPLLSGRSMLEYPRDAVGGLILALESALTLSIATILSMFLPDERPA